MAVQHIKYTVDASHPASQKLNNFLRHLEAVMDDGPDILATMALMLDGDGSNIAHFDYFKGQYGIADNTISKALYDEINSAMAKITGNGSVSNVNAALVQLLNKTR